MTAMWLFGLTLFLPQAETAPIVPVQYTRDTLVPVVQQIALEKAVSGRLMIRIIDCEDSDWNPEQQSNLSYKFSDPKRGIVKGTRERSYGLTMIHLPDHPEITKEEAEDPDFALNRMADEIKAGRASQWSCF